MNARTPTPPNRPMTVGQDGDDKPTETPAKMEARLRAAITAELTAKLTRKIIVEHEARSAAKIQKILDLAVKFAPSTLYRVFSAPVLDRRPEDENDGDTTPDFAPLRDFAGANDVPALYTKDQAFLFGTFVSSLVKAACNRVVAMGGDTKRKIVFALPLKDAAPKETTAYDDLSDGEKAQRIAAVGTR